MKRLNRHTRRTLTGSQRNTRRGSAMLLCFLAIAVISVASIAITRSHRRLNLRRSVMQSSAQGRLVADGLLNREIAYQRIVAGGSSTPADKSLSDLAGFEKAAIKLASIDTSTQTMGVDIALYNGAPVLRYTGVHYGIGGATSPGF